MLSPDDTEEIRRVLYQEYDWLSRAKCLAGSYTYLCLVDGLPTYTHTPCGTVLQQVRSAK